MAGDGPLKPGCIDLAHELGLEEAVTFVGAATPDLVRSLMARSFAFAQHSIIASDGDSEGTPVSILEAGSASLPVVATRHGGIMDVVIDGATGVLVEERDVARMSDALVELALNKSLARRMGNAARYHISHHFTLEKHIDAVARAVRGAVDERSRLR
jgi:glycosyltransferase involved in cell wall biosynthesis